MLPDIMDGIGGGLLGALSTVLIYLFVLKERLENIKTQLSRQDYTQDIVEHEVRLSVIEEKLRAQEETRRRLLEAIQARRDARGDVDRRDGVSGVDGRGEPEEEGAGPPV